MAAASDIGRRTLSLLRRREAALGYIFILPAAFFLLCFVLYPLVSSLSLSFSRYNFIYSQRPEWIGLKNYLFLFTNEDALTALLNTAKFMLFYVPALLVLGLLIASIINSTTLPSSVPQALIFIPVAIPLSICGIMFQWLYNYQFGLLNAGLTFIGFGRFTRPWLSEQGTALKAMAFVMLWKDLGLSTILFLAGLQSIPRDLYDAAEIDGAGRNLRFRYITLPNLRETFVLSAIWGFIQSWKVFALPYVMTRGGPGNSTLTLYLYTYRLAFEFYNMGTASAMAFFVALIIIGFSVLTMRLVGRSERQ
jgi:ABC-type sugar transport system permease subunit